MTSNLMNETISIWILATYGQTLGELGFYHSWSQNFVTTCKSHWITTVQSLPNFLCNDIVIFYELFLP